MFASAFTVWWIVWERNRATTPLVSGMGPALPAEAYFARGMRVWVGSSAGDERYAGVITAPPSDELGVWQVRRGHAGEPGGRG
eukprot:COSAG02_NODE_36712_length_451_cov_1.164773_1_plen_82_part_01